MALIRDLTINQYFDVVCGWYDNNGNGYLQSKVPEKNNIEVTYTVLWSLLALAGQEKWNELKGKPGCKFAQSNNTTITYNLVQIGCKLKGAKDKDGWPIHTLRF